ncbi:MAG: GNAT family N-acetyltransferase [Patescibacteria group bacterium]
MYFVYILRTYENTLYTGITKNLKRRLHEHNHVKSRAAQYTWVRRPVELVYNEEYSTIGLAMKREREIKKMTRDKKLKLIGGGKILGVDPRVKHEDDIIVKNYSDNDYTSIKNILQEAQLFDETWDSPENLFGMIKQHKDAVLIAVVGKNIVGVVYLIPFGPKFIQLFRLAVKKEYRNLGIATKLLNKAHEVAKKRGVLETGLFVESVKSDLQSFYKKRGFGGSKKEYVFMWKAIDKNNV